MRCEPLAEDPTTLENDSGLEEGASNEGDRTEAVAGDENGNSVDNFQSTEANGAASEEEPAGENHIAGEEGPAGEEVGQKQTAGEGHIASNDQPAGGESGNGPEPAD